MRPISRRCFTSASVRFAAVDFQLFNGAQGSERAANMQGFVRSYFSQTQDVGHSQAVMYYFPPSKLLVLTNLAQNYAICDHWFSSVPGPTLPNRAFVHAATSNGRVDNSLLTAVGPKTVYEMLAEHGVASKIYVYDNQSGSSEAALLKKQPQFFGTFDQFIVDAHRGNLPAYSFVEPNFSDHDSADGLQVATDQHADHSVLAGESFLAEVYGAIRTNPTLWESTILVIVYSQHGGLYDHVVPPPTASPDDKAAVNPAPGVPSFDFSRLGVRVPAVIVSPYIEPGTIDKTVYDHTSIIATARKLFLGPGWERIYLTKRDQQANTFEHLLTRSTPQSGIDFQQTSQ